MVALQRYFPVLGWGRNYNRSNFSNDLLAAAIVTIMLVPQSLAYALLAGLPPEMGLYASIMPIVLYAIFGTSRSLAVGPVAVVSLMTAAAVGKIAETGSADYIAAALTLAFLSGLFLMLMGVFRLGFLANFLSHPVIAGFITASGIIIATSQLKHILAIDVQGHTLVGQIVSIVTNIGEIHWLTLVMGISTTAFLFWARKGLTKALFRLGLSAKIAAAVGKTGPVLMVIVTIFLAWLLDLGTKGVPLVGAVPQGLPPLSLPSFNIDVWSSLVGSAVLISVIGFVESVSVAQTLAAKKRERIDPDQELIGLGTANLGASFTGGFPVTGGFSRSVVNFDAGADTPAAGAYAAMGLAFTSLFLTPLIYYLPKATLAATIIVAVTSLIDFSILKRAWVYAKADFIAVAITIFVTLGFGVEFGVTAGLLLSILIHLYKTSRPHFAIVGQVPGSEHFRNVLRHDVITDPAVLGIRVDESLFFANARFLEDTIYDEARKMHELKHVVLLCSAVNSIDMSALESLEAINLRLNDIGVKLHLSEVKGPVMDRLKRCDFLEHLTGDVFLSQHQAMAALGSGTSAT